MEWMDQHGEAWIRTDAVSTGWVLAVREQLLTTLRLGRHNEATCCLGAVCWGFLVAAGVLGDDGVWERSGQAEDHLVAGELAERSDGVHAHGLAVNYSE